MVLSRRRPRRRRRQSCRARAARTEWVTVWKPQPVVADGEPGGSGDPMPAPMPAPVTPAPLTKKRKVTLSSLLRGRVKKEVLTMPAGDALVAFDELEQYLAFWLSLRPRRRTSISKCSPGGKTRRLSGQILPRWSSSTLPPQPPLAGGVERVFSAAGAMHGDLQKLANTRRLSIRSLPLNTD